MNIQKKSIKSLVDNRQPVYVQFLVCSLSLFISFSFSFALFSLLSTICVFSIVFLSFSSSITFFLWAIFPFCSHLPFLILIRFVSFSALSLIITIYVMLFVNEHKKMPDYYQTRPLFSLIYDQRLNSFPSLLYIHTDNKVDH